MSKNIHGGGFVIVASSRGPQRDKLREPTDECKVTWRSWFKRSYGCGHHDSRRFRLSTFGAESIVVNQALLCPECMLAEHKKETILCALCGLPIFPGSAVAVYDADNEGIRECAHKIGNSVLGCMRWDCCPSGGFFAGHWMGDKFKPYFE